MPIYNINVLLEVMNMIFSICIPMDQSLRYYTFFGEKPSVKASLKTLAFVMTDSLTAMPFCRFIIKELIGNEVKLEDSHYLISRLTKKLQ